jgi:hypothetical protein
MAMPNDWSYPWSNRTKTLFKGAKETLVLGPMIKLLTFKKRFGSGFFSQN